MRPRSEQPAFPRVTGYRGAAEGNYEEVDSWDGLTIREYIAIQARFSGCDDQEAFELADRFLEEMEKQQK